MTQEDIIAKISSLEDQIRNLLSRQHEVESRNELLENQLKQAKIRMAEQEKQLLQQKMKKQQLSLDFDFEPAPDKKNEPLKNKLHEYIKELDRCIALLSNETH